MEIKKLGVLVWMMIVFLLAGVPGSTYGSEEEMTEYIVAEGDNLVTICRDILEDAKDWPEIAKINKISNPNVIRPGMKIAIPLRFLKLKPTAGRVTFVKGDVKKRPESGALWKEVIIDDIMRKDDRIKTGDGSRVEITYEDGSSLMLWENTTLIIEKSGRRKTRFLRKFLMKSGRAISKVSKKYGKDSDFKIRTKTAIVGVRGTEFRVSVDSEESLRSEVLDGRVAVSAMSREVAVDKGQGTLVKKGEPPLPPRKMLPPPKPVNIKDRYDKLPITLEFESVPNATYYRVMLARDPDFKDVVWSKKVLPGEAISIKDLGKGEYYLQSTSIDDIGLEGVPHEPLAVSLSFMAVDILIEKKEKRKITASWSDLGEGMTYHFQAARDVGFKDIFLDKRLAEPFLTIEKPEEYGKYFFRVNAIDPKGNETGFSKPGALAIKEKRNTPVLILADVSGSMQEKTEIYHPKKGGGKKSVTKAVAMKEVLIKLSRSLESSSCDHGIYLVRYLPGDKDMYERFLPVENYGENESVDRIKDDFKVEFPFFNRRTALGKMFRQLDEKELDSANGEVTLLLISDGKETVRKGNKDILSGIKNLKDKYKKSLILHTVYLGKKESNKEIRFLEDMAKEGGGRFFSGHGLLSKEGMIEEVSSLICSPGETEDISSE